MSVPTCGVRTMPQRWQWTKHDVCNQIKTTHLSQLWILTRRNSWNIPALKGLWGTKPILLTFGDYIKFVRLIKQKKKEAMTKNNHRSNTSWSPTIPSSEGDEVLLTCLPAQKNFPSTSWRRGKISNWKPPISAFPVTCSSTVYPEPRSAATNFYVVQTNSLIWRETY